ncbi:aminopeptidase P family protein [Pseudooceanicola sp. C21-150M6]|uniref:aminopeptidase P family protein n=1 Tax=Pseudooceanicola sp. C21-150M6 TaxID=3434355 RepID=UPI003D7F7038
MFQTFDTATSPEQGPPRLAALRADMTRLGLDAVLVPRADRFQGEYVADRDARLAWLTGFTGSAGFCAVTADKAAVFVDGRYTVQVREQVALSDFTPVDWPATSLAQWLKRSLAEDAVLGFDPWLHTVDEITRLSRALPRLELRGIDNPVDAIWTDQPAAPMAPIFAHPLEFAGEDHAAKRARLADELRSAGEAAALITLPDSVAWLFNIRGGDIPRNPIPHAFALLRADGSAVLLTEPDKCAGLGDHLGADVSVMPPDQLADLLATVEGTLRIDPSSAPQALIALAALAGVNLSHGADPARLPKAIKNPAELQGMRDAHLRDAAAMCRFLAWYDAADQTALSEVELVVALEGFRADTNMLREISFDTIAGAGPNGALPHYKVSAESSRRLEEGQLVVLDSGGQYPDGTTDITRTLVVGQAGAEETRAFTLVLKGMIAMSRVRFPRGVTGGHLDSLARYPLWLAGMDYDHGTGHGVGAYLCVHEGPQRLSRTSDVALEPGMILSNEPGYYREGAFGIRIENLIVVQEAAPVPGGDARDWLDFETLTWVPIDRRLIDTGLLSAEEREWVDSYHAACRDKIGPLLSGETAVWFASATEKLD